MNPPMVVNFADYGEQSLYQKSVESRPFDERVTQQEAKPADFREMRNPNEARDRYLEE